MPPKPRRTTWNIQLEFDKSVQLLTYMAIEYAIDMLEEDFMNRKMIEPHANDFLDVVEEGINSRRSSIDKLMKKTRSYLTSRLDQLPPKQTISKPDIVRKFTFYNGQAIMPYEITDITKHIQLDSNATRDKSIISDDRYIYTTSHMQCDIGTRNRYNRIDVNIESSGTYNILLNNTIPFLSYTCKGGIGSYKKFGKEKTYKTLTTHELDKKIDRVKTIGDTVDLYLSHEVKDLGVIISSKIFGLTFFTHDAFAMLFSTKIFGVDVIYSRPKTPRDLYYYKA